MKKTEDNHDAHSQRQEVFVHPSWQEAGRSSSQAGQDQALPVLWKEGEAVVDPIAGVVCRGAQFPHKPPTANFMPEKPIPVACYLGEAYRGRPTDSGADYLGDFFAWPTMQPDTVPGCLEVYISYFHDDLYDQVITLQNLRPVGRDLLCVMFNDMISMYRRLPPHHPPTVI